MDRRRFLKWSGLGFIFSLLPSIGLSIETEKRAFFLMHDSDPDSVLSFLKGITEHKKFKYRGWHKNLSILDIHKDKAKVQNLIAHYGSNTTKFNWPIMIAVPEDKRRVQDVELWNLDWLDQISQQQVRKDLACYPIRNGSYWSVEGDWNPTKEKVKNHLFKSPNHVSGKFEDHWLKELNHMELQSIHSDHHDEMANRMHSVKWPYVNVECPE